MEERKTVLVTGGSRGIGKDGRLVHGRMPKFFPENMSFYRIL